MPTIELSTRPAKVVLAVKVLYLFVALGVIRTALMMIRHLDVRSPFIDIVTNLLLYAASLYLIHQLSKRKNWARWSLVAILFVSLFLLLLPTFDSFTLNPINTLLVFVQYTLYVVALVLLFHREAQGWFGPNPASRTDLK